MSGVVIPAHLKPLEKAKKVLLEPTDAQHARCKEIMKERLQVKAELVANEAECARLKWEMDRLNEREAALDYELQFYSNLKE